MKEQSHKNEMRAALRGDFERLRARRVDVSAPVVLATPLEEPAAEPEAEHLVESVATEPVGTVTQSSRSSWLDRLRDRY